MGESKRRKEVLGEKYGNPEPAWYGIGAMVVIWVTIRFIGPAFGWWHLAD